MLNEPKASPSGAFVLKTHFNPAWSAFNVHELGKVVVESWRSSLHHYDVRQLKRTLAPGPVPGVDLPPEEVYIGSVPRVSSVPVAEYSGDTVQRTLTDLWAGRAWRTVNAGPSDLDSASPQPGSSDMEVDGQPLMDISPGGSPSGVEPLDGSVDPEPADLGGNQYHVVAHAPQPLIETGLLLPVAWGNAQELETVLDVRFNGLIDNQWIVSRKRNRNLGDFVFTWKKSLLKFASEEDVLMEHVDEWL